jgi:hypothetical protein
LLLEKGGFPLVYEIFFMVHCNIVATSRSALEVLMKLALRISPVDKKAHRGSDSSFQRRSGIYFEKPLKLGSGLLPYFKISHHFESPDHCRVIPSFTTMRRTRIKQLLRCGSVWKSNAK